MTDNQVQVALEKFRPYMPIGANGDIVSESGGTLRSKLEAADDDCMDGLMQIKLKSKTVTLLLAIFLGGIGAARFYIGDKGIGIARIIATVAVGFASLVPILGIIAYVASFIWILADIYGSRKRVMQLNFGEISTFLFYHTKKN